MDREKAKLYFKEEVKRYQLVYMHCSTQNLEKGTISDIMNAVMEIAMRLMLHGSPSELIRITSEGENRTTVRRPIHERYLSLSGT